MDVSALLVSRIQFAFTLSLHIIFPAKRRREDVPSWIAVQSQ